ncbi:uncharacterized protein BYT42DRAFT_596508 [Radiomyces spectabilis]|uniref:uncharacterized protein n=1 Tax=Radiomyces spectabilis TaxID=64574 RepID=UPI00221EC046|nr:uncharacterized protein BYT42DRAFT_596508 [Radiomyces spectabilis]KAI8393847.1 hypothetical protein BYT42DRAFT_596508 [Radiomyces spectabilis]
MNQRVIREYQPSDAGGIRELYAERAHQLRRKQVLQSVITETAPRRFWQAGTVGILGLHMSQTLREQSSVMTLLVELALWSAGLGFAWYLWLNSKYQRSITARSYSVVNDFSNQRLKSKSNAWVMVEGNKVIGAVMLSFEGGEGRIRSLTGGKSQIELPLVQTAILFARQNKIQIACLSRLTYLDLSHNQLETLPPTIKQLKRLRHLDLSHNRIRHIPESLQALTKLTDLNLSNNPIDYVPSSIARLIGLITLDLSYTKIEGVPAELMQLSLPTLRTQHCDNMERKIQGFRYSVRHNPPSLLETCARRLIAPLLLDAARRKKRKRNEVLAGSLKKLTDDLPTHLFVRISAFSQCSFCGGPYFELPILRYRIMRRQDDSWVLIEYRLCSAHWADEKGRLLALFAEQPVGSLTAKQLPVELFQGFTGDEFNL